MHKLVAYKIHANDSAPLRSARRDRRWIEETDQKFAYRCLPLLIANQYGWEIISTHHIRAAWDGTSHKDGIKIENLYGDGPLHCGSHFGAGVLTFSIPFLFRTPKDWNLMVRGPMNNPKDGIAALDGVIETDWSHATFTMNWRFTRACSVEFNIGEPICVFFPIQRGCLELFDPEICMLESDPELQCKFSQWSSERDQFLYGLQTREPAIVKQGWQKTYQAAAVETKLRVPEFRVLSPDSGPELVE